jgi:hypothetical protein
MRSIWGISYIKRKMRERAANQKEETPSDKSARITATATKWMAVCTFILALITGGTLIVLKLQLKEMHEGGVDTKALAIALVSKRMRSKRWRTSLLSPLRKRTILSDKLPLRREPLIISRWKQSDLMLSPVKQPRAHGWK